VQQQQTAKLVDSFDELLPTTSHVIIRQQNATLVAHGKSEVYESRGFGFLFFYL
jgi:hypothetical protein